MVGSIRAVGGCVRVGEIVYNTLTGGETEKKGGETKILKKDGKLGEAGTPLRIFCVNVLKETVSSK